MSASFGKRRALFVLELGGAYCVAHGIGMISQPAMFITVGVAAIVAVEIRGS